MEVDLPLTTAELHHCERFCFNGGSCFQCARDPYDLAQCVGCICPQDLWAGQRCEIRRGFRSWHFGYSISFITSIIFAIFAFFLAVITLFIYIQRRRRIVKNAIGPESTFPGTNANHEGLDQPKLSHEFAVAYHPNNIQ